MLISSFELHCICQIRLVRLGIPDANEEEKHQGKSTRNSYTVVHSQAITATMLDVMKHKVTW